MGKNLIPQNPGEERAGSRDRIDMADTKGESFFGSVEEYVAARGGNRVIKKVRICTSKHLSHEIMPAVSLGFRQHGCQPDVCIRDTSIFYDAETPADML